MTFDEWWMEEGYEETKYAYELKKEGWEAAWDYQQKIIDSYKEKDKQLLEDLKRVDENSWE